MEKRVTKAPSFNFSFVEDKKVCILRRFFISVFYFFMEAIGTHLKWIAFSFGCVATNSSISIKYSICTRFGEVFPLSLILVYVIAQGHCTGHTHTIHIKENIFFERNSRGKLLSTFQHTTEILPYRSALTSNGIC